MTEYNYELRIPKERIAVLIGEKGKIKKQIETETKTKIAIDSKEGDVSITGEDALGLYSAREIVHAISRGFNPDIAQLLLKQDYMFEVINIMDYIETKDSMVRLKGRVIGRAGKSRQLIEELTETHISVYGKTIGIIGPPENVAIARKAIKTLLEGGSHANVYKWLEKSRRKERIK